MKKYDSKNVSIKKSSPRNGLVLSVSSLVVPLLQLFFAVNPFEKGVESAMNYSLVMMLLKPSKYDIFMCK